MNVVKNLDLRNSAEYDEFCHPPVYDRVLHPGDLGRLYQDLELEEVGEMRLTDLLDNFKTRLKKRKSHNLKKVIKAIRDRNFCMRCLS